MYTQAMDTMGKDEAKKAVRSAEEMQLEARFDELYTDDRDHWPLP